jgi:hypothetical protein
LTSPGLSSPTKVKTSEIMVGLLRLTRGRLF